jgi:hypothetical protein
MDRAAFERKQDLVAGPPAARPVLAWPSRA